MSITLGHIEWERCQGCEWRIDNPGDAPPCHLVGGADWLQGLEFCADGAVVCHSYRDKEA